jgi:1-acylglycerone phosphate reductase
MTGAVLSNFPYSMLPPSSSLFIVAQKTVEKAITGGDAATNGSDSFKWADQIVRDLSKRNPPHWVWRGAVSSVVWMASFFPVGIIDGFIKKIVGMDVVERKTREQG